MNQEPKIRQKLLATAAALGIIAGGAALGAKNNTESFSPTDPAPIGKDGTQTPAFPEFAAGPNPPSGVKLANQAPAYPEGAKGPNPAPSEVPLAQPNAEPQIIPNGNGAYLPVNPPGNGLGAK